MNGLKTYSRWIGPVALLFGAVGCVPKQALRTSFLPPSPPAARAALVSPDPPPPEAPPEMAAPDRSALPLPPPPVDNRGDVVIREAEWHYQAGRTCYRGGDADCARREFDRAVDVLLSAPEDISSRASIDKKLDDLVDAIHRLDLAGLGAGDTASEPAFEKPPLEDLPELTFPVDPALKSKVAEELRATVSQLPLEITDPVLSYINYFTTGRGRRALIYGLRRSGRYKPLIQRIFDEEGVPQELIYLAQVESGFLPRAVSRKRATGMWQFMQARGRQYGLEQTPYTDDRLDPEKATRAAARHLRDLYHHFGDWYLAMAAYNWGPVAVDRVVERTGYADFWELSRRDMLPQQTATYVPAILAITFIMKNAKEYGLDNIETDPPWEYDTLEITAPTQLQLVADLAECPISQLHDLNPALLKNVAPAGTLLRVPKGSDVALAAVLETVPPERRETWRAHRVAVGESLPAIAQRYGVTQNSIIAANRADLSGLEAGDLLMIPAAPPRTKAVRHRARRSGAVPHRTVTARNHGAGPARRPMAASTKRGRTRPANYTAANDRPSRAVKRASVKE
jgi:membrane-bound lytic murein transglycosylase D